jgi:hypothetical protein
LRQELGKRASGCNERGLGRVKVNAQSGVKGRIRNREQATQRRWRSDDGAVRGLGQQMLWGKLLRRTEGCPTGIVGWRGTIPAVGGCKGRRSEERPPHTRGEDRPPFAREYR